MPEITYRQALNEALDEELGRDKNVVIIGEEVAEYNGAYKVTEGLWEKWGDKRLIDAPISEAGFIGMGIGASMLGVRPVMELMFFSFAYVAFDQMMNSILWILSLLGSCPCRHPSQDLDSLVNRSNGVEVKLSNSHSL